MTSSVSQVEIVEVSPRDGLQNFARTVDTATKVSLIRQCLDAGADRIEVASFVSPRRVPQMADAEEVIEVLPSPLATKYIGLVLNQRGLQRALQTKVGEVNVVIGATDSFNLKNQGMAIRDALDMLDVVSQAGHDAGVRVTATVAVAFGCPFEGEVDEATVCSLVDRLASHDLDEIALADTIGVAVPSQVRRLFDQVASTVPAVARRAHFHNTRNTGFANVYAALEAGVSVFDASVGGLGGCPFAPNATGNIATEDLVYMLDRMGISTHLSLKDYIEIAKWLGSELETKLPGMVSKAGPFPRSADS